MDSYEETKSGDRMMLKYFGIGSHKELENFVNGKISHDSVGIFICITEVIVWKGLLSQEKKQQVCVIINILY